MAEKHLAAQRWLAEAESRLRDAKETVGRLANALDAETEGIEEDAKAAIEAVDHALSEAFDMMLAEDAGSLRVPAVADAQQGEVGERYAGGEGYAERGGRPDLTSGGPVLTGPAPAEETPAETEEPVADAAQGEAGETEAGGEGYAAQAGPADTVPGVEGPADAEFSEEQMGLEKAEDGHAVEGTEPPAE